MTSSIPKHVAIIGAGLSVSPAAIREVMFPDKMNPGAQPGTCTAQSVYPVQYLRIAAKVIHSGRGNHALAQRPSCP